jgi:hypothetical protein
MLYKPQNAILAPDPGISKDASSFPSPDPFSPFAFPNVPKHQSRIFHGSWILPLFPIRKIATKLKDNSAGIPEFEYVLPPTKYRAQAT